MSLLSDAKIIGGIGALLTLLFVIPTYGFIIGIIGFILVILAVKYISDETKDKSIFNNFLYFIIITIVACVVAGVIFIITILELGGPSYIFELQNMAYSDPWAVWEKIQPLIVGALVSLVVLWVLMIVSTIYLRKSYDKIREYTNVKWFGTAGFLFLLGAVTIIIVIGFLIILIAMVIEIIAFFSLPEKLPEKTK